MGRKKREELAEVPVNIRLDNVSSKYIERTAKRKAVPASDVHRELLAEAIEARRRNRGGGASSLLDLGDDVDGELSLEKQIKQVGDVTSKTRFEVGNLRKLDLQVLMEILITRSLLESYIRAVNKDFDYAAAFAESSRRANIIIAKIERDNSDSASEQ